MVDLISVNYMGRVVNFFFFFWSKGGLLTLNLIKLMFFWEKISNKKMDGLLECMAMTLTFLGRINLSVYVFKEVKIRTKAVAWLAR